MSFSMQRKHVIPAGSTLGFPVSDSAPVKFRLIPGDGGSASLYTSVLSNSFSREGTVVSNDSISDISEPWPHGEVTAVTSDTEEGPISGYIVSAVGADAELEVLQ